MSLGLSTSPDLRFSLDLGVTSTDGCLTDPLKPLLVSVIAVMQLNKVWWMFGVWRHEYLSVMGFALAQIHTGVWVFW